MNITTAIIISFAVSLVVTAALGFVLIPVLHKHYLLSGRLCTLQ